MRIAIVSDTHGNWPIVAEAIREIGGVDYLMFLGDYASDGRSLEKTLHVPSFLVRGNCDSDISEVEEQVIELGDWRFFLTHGHRYRVKQTLQSLYYRGMELQADFVLYGHTHQALYEEREITMINPGAVDEWNLRFENASWGLLTLPDKKSGKILKKYEKKLAKRNRT